MKHLAKCIGCRCDDLHACVSYNKPCHWLRVDYGIGWGVCSACPELVQTWDMNLARIPNAEWRVR